MKILIHEEVETEHDMVYLLEEITAQINRGMTSGYHPTWELGAMTEEELAALIAQHHHEYDSDCSSDFGCSCSAKLPENKEDGSQMSRGEQLYAVHLAAVITAAVKAAQPPFNS